MNWIKCLIYNYVEITLFIIIVVVVYALIIISPVLV